MKVPLLDLSAQHGPLHDDLLRALDRVLRSQHFILGSEVDSFEKAVSAYCQVPHAVGVSSGTDALLAALMALNVQSGDEVITTPYSFFATAGVIARLNAKPVFVDIDPETFNMDARCIEKAITSKTKVILPVHLFGQCADMAPLLALATKRKLAVVEDAAQALGAQYSDGKAAGTMGTIGTYSFFPSKNLGALGDAGMMVTRDTSLAEKLRAFRVHGAKQKYYHTWVGGNFRLDAIQAAVLSVKLPHLDRWSQSRQDNAQYYDKLLKDSGLLQKNQIRLPRAAYSGKGLPRPHIYNQYVVRVERRDALRDHLRAAEIGTEVYYPVPLHLQECFKSLGHKVGDFPEAEKAAKDSLALPIFPELTKSMQETVVQSIKEFYSK